MRRTITIGVASLIVVGASLAVWALSEREDHTASTASTPSVSKTTPRDWPTYGGTNSRTRFAPFALRPPYRRLWSLYGDSSFIEFPPVVVAGRLYFATDRGRLVAADARDGGVLWDRALRHCTAASPAVEENTVVITTMAPPPCNRGRGEVIALDTNTGRVRWRFVATPIESSPLIVGGLVVVGERDGRVFALDLRNGRLRWSFRTGAAVKGSASAVGETVYIGSYDGHVYAVIARTGRLRWRAPAGGSRARFYATPALANGRVVIGGTDGVVYSFAAQSGRVQWTRRLGSFVYSAAAIAQGRVFVGSYDHHLYALDESTGEILWSHESRGPVSGAPTVLDGLVFFSSCGSCSPYESDTSARRTNALDVASGRLIWEFPDGEYSPVVTDGARVYLTGYTTVYALAPARDSRPRR